MFKLQHPQDLISRLFILEYIREIGATTIVAKLNEGEKKFWAYKFSNDEGEIEYDLNWEYLLFVIPLDNLSKIMERYLSLVEEIELKRKPKVASKIDEILQERLEAPVDVNLFDVAKADIESKKHGIQYL